MEPIDLISAIKDATPDAEYKYTRGACFHLFLTLRLAFDSAECWYDMIEGHVYTKIDGVFYDIRGAIEPPIETMRLIQEPRIYQEAFSWVEGLTSG